MSVGCGSLTSEALGDSVGDPGARYQYPNVQAMGAFSFAGIRPGDDEDTIQALLQKYSILAEL